MALTVAQVVNAARDYHAAFTEQYAPSAVGTRFIDRWQRSLIMEITRSVPEFISQTKVHTIADADFTTGINLLSAPPSEDLWQHGVMEVKRLVAQSTLDPTYYGQAQVTLLPFAAELQSFVGLGAVLDTGTVLRLMGQPIDWHAYSTLSITVTPAPAPLLNGGSLLILPDDALDAASLALAAFFATRLTTDPAVKAKRSDAAALEMQAAAMRSNFLFRIQQQQSRQDIRIIERW